MRNCDERPDGHPPLRTKNTRDRASRVSPPAKIGRHVGLAFALLLCLSAVACGSSLSPATLTPETIDPPATDDSATSMPPTATPPNEIAPAETVLTPSQSGQTVAVSIGELIAVVNPDPTIEWQVDYGSAILTLLASPADAGTDDWLFEAAAEGTTDLALTSSPPPCSATPCPSTVIRLVYSIEVTAEEMAPDATVITPAQANQSVSVQVGEQIIVENPDPTQKWQVDYAPAILTLLASPADAGTNDWLFEAAAEGTTDLALTSSPPPCPGTPCPSTVMRLVYSIEVSP